MDLRLINLYDDDTNFLAITNAPKEEIQLALDYKNKMLENDDLSFRSDFEEMQDFLQKRGYVLGQVGYITDIESYLW